MVNLQRLRPESQTSVTKLLSFLGGLAACIFAIAIPALYYLTSLRESRLVLETETAFVAKSIEDIIQSRPDMWEFETLRLTEIISKPPLNRKTHQDEREIRNAAGETVVKTDFTQTGRSISVSKEVFDSGQAVGIITAKHSTHSEIVTTGVLAIFSSLFGGLLYFTFRVYPIRKLRKTLADLQREQNHLLHVAADLEQANEEVKHFAFVISHDLKAPLVNLKGFAGELRSSVHFLASTFESTLPHLSEENAKAVAQTIRMDLPDCLGFIEESVTKIHHLANALLSLSRMGRREMYLENLNMNDIVAKVLKNLAVPLQSSGARVHVEPLPGVLADRTAMEQIMGNLLENAVNYLQPDRPGKIEVDGKDNAEETVFFVRDNGRGIAQEDMAKVFAPFRRAGRQDVQGAGMGLAYVQTLVHRHGGGRIRCESEPGVGTTFTFSIPHPLQQGESHG